MKVNILHQSLLDLGLSDFLAKLYTELIQDQELNITKIADKLDTYRQRVYDGIEELEVKGLVERKRGQLSNIESPSKVIRLLNQKISGLEITKEKLAEALPTFQASYFSNRKTPLTQVYQGKVQFLNLFYRTLEESEQNDEILIYSEGRDFYNLIDMPTYYESWAVPRVQKGVLVRAIFKNEFENDKYFINFLKRDKQELRTSKFLPKDNLQPGTIWITKNRVIFWNTLIPQAVTIEDKQILDFQKANFELVWRSLPPLD
ncbi:MAG: helix-turn-helix domain-containing protein [bacterium]